MQQTSYIIHIIQISKERRQWYTLSKPDIAEKSKGLGGNPVAGPEAALCPACESFEDVSSLEFLFSAAPALSSKKILTCVKLMHFQDSRT